MTRKLSRGRRIAACLGRNLRRVGDCAGRRWIGALALAAYLFGSLGLAAPAPLRHSLLARVGCSCPSADVQSGVCCCAGKPGGQSCCAQQPAADESRSPQVEELNSSESNGTQAGCCSRPADDGDAGPQIAACPCGSSGGDEILMCGDPRLVVPAVGICLDHASQPLLTGLTPFRDGRAHQPPTPPPRAICG